MASLGVHEAVETNRLAQSNRLAPVGRTHGDGSGRRRLVHQCVQRLRAMEEWAADGSQFFPNRGVAAEPEECGTLQGGGDQRLCGTLAMVHGGTASGTAGSRNAGDLRAELDGTFQQE